MRGSGCRTLWVAGVVLAVMPGAVEAHAAASALQTRSVLHLCFETADGVDTGGCALEPAVRQVVLDEGGTLIDPAQAARLRQEYTPERFAQNADLKGIDLLDADFAVVTKTRVTKLLALGKVTRFQVDVSVDVLDPSRAAWVFSRSETYALPALQAVQAAMLAVQQFRAGAGATLRQDVVAALLAPRPVELWVYDLRDGFAQVNGIEKAIRDSTLASSVKRTAFDKGVGRWRVLIAAGHDSDELASSLENAGLMLRVQGATHQMLQLAFRPESALRFECVLTTSAARAGLPAYVGATLDGVVRNALFGVGWLTPRTATDGSAPFFLDVKASGVGKGRVALAWTLSRAGGIRLAGARTVGRVDDLAALSAQGLADVLDGFKGWLVKHPAELGELRRMLDAPRSVDAGLALAAGARVDVALVPEVGAFALGSVQVRTKLDEARVRARVDGLSDWSEAVPVRDGVAPVDVAAGAAWRALDEPKATRVVVELDGRIGERLYRQELTAPVLVLPRNTVELAVPASIARAMDPAPAFAATLLLPALLDVDDTPSVPLARAARIWDVLARFKLKVEPSADDGAFVVVAGPAATLVAGGGDARALAVLVGSAFEAAGVETRIVRTPTTWLVAVDTGLPDAATALGRAPTTLLAQAGRSFAVLMPTALDGDLWHAVAAGGAEWQRQQAKATVVEPRAEWKRTPPTSDRRAVPAPPAPAEAVRAMVVDVAGAAVAVDDRRAIASRVAAALGGHPQLRVMTTDDVRALLSAEASKQLVGCDAASCLAEIADAVGARFVVVGAAGAGGVLTISVLDARSAETIDRFELRGASTEWLLELPREAGERARRAVLSRLGVVASDGPAFRAWLRQSRGGPR